MRARINLSQRYLHVILGGGAPELCEVLAEVGKRTRFGLSASSVYRVLWLLIGGLGS
jgi:hypothetical protein